MSNYNAGDIIRLTRQSLGISQEELCYDICSVQTLSRIENGHHTVKRTTYKKLMERMGRFGEKSYSNINVEKLELLDVMKKLNTASAKHEYDKMEEYIAVLRENMDIEHDIKNRQYIRRKEILVDYHKKRISKEEKLQQLEEIAALSLPDYHTLLDKTYPFMNEELQIVMNIAGTYEDLCDFKKAIKILEMLIRSLDTGYMDENNTIQLKVILMSNMARSYNGLDEYDTAIMIEEEVIKICKKNKLCSVLQNAYIELAWSMICQIKDGVRDKKDYEMCKKYLRQGYAIAVISENFYTSRQVKNIYEMVFHEDIYCSSSLSLGETV